jgi:hypothetical protein
MSDSKSYLDLVNAVLVRLREDKVASVNGNDDVVVELVKEFVNDAKKTVEDAHTWSALTHEWSIDLGAQPSAEGVLTGSFGSAIIDYVMDSEGNVIRNQPLSYINRRLIQNGTTSTLAPSAWTVSGKTVNGNQLRTKIKFDCLIDDSQNPLTAYGYQPQTELSEDFDVLLVPAKPVIYLASALASRERGEVGGQSAGELMMIAQKYISDSIAMDSTNSDLDNIWMTV